jgi:hypothetical protein
MTASSKRRTTPLRFGGQPMLPKTSSVVELKKILAGSGRMRVGEGQGFGAKARNETAGKSRRFSLSCKPPLL